MNVKTADEIKWPAIGGIALEFSATENLTTIKLSNNRRIMALIGIPDAFRLYESDTLQLVQLVIKITTRNYFLIVLNAQQT